MNITVFRPMDDCNGTRSYQIKIDNVAVATISVGEKINVPIPIGASELKVTIDWCSSKIINLKSISLGEIFEVKKSFPTADSIFTELYYLTIGYNKYISIEKIFSRNDNHSKSEGESNIGFTTSVSKKHKSIDKWYEKNNLDHSKQSDNDKNILEEDIRLYWHFLRANKFSIFTGIFVELYFRPSERLLFAHGLVVNKEGDAVLVDKKPLSVKVMVKESGDFVTLEVNEKIEIVGICFNFTCKFYNFFGPQFSHWRLDKITSEVSFEVPSRSYKKEILNACNVEYINDGSETTHVNEVMCDVCFGTGSHKQFSIPREEADKGYSGYQLYSCNTVNGVYGCEACGGKGAQYKDWYLKENPSLDETLNQYSAGAGYYFSERMPNVCNLNIAD